jgi:hypothetical protein
MCTRNQESAFVKRCRNKVMKSCCMGRKGDESMQCVSCMCVRMPHVCVFVCIMYACTYASCMHVRMPHVCMYVCMYVSCIMYVCLMYACKCSLCACEVHKWQRNEAMRNIQHMYTRSISSIHTHTGKYMHSCLPANNGTQLRHRPPESNIRSIYTYDIRSIYAYDTYMHIRSVYTHNTYIHTYIEEYNMNICLRGQHR